MSLYSLRMADRWRSAYNPLRGLTMSRVSSMLDEGERGAYADLQWLYRKIEKRDATLRGVVRKLRAALLKLDWDVKVPADLPEAQKAMAETQRRALRAEYDKIGNIRRALAFLALAEFRGFSHLEIVRGTGGSVVRLEPVPQWHWCRDGLYGDWQFNELSTSGQTIGEPIDARGFIIREVDDPVDEIAAIAFVRKSLSQKDWDGFVEVYGIPPLFGVMPPGVPETERDKWQAMMEQAVGDSRGVLPSGGDVKTVGDSARGIQPFEGHIRYQDEQTVLAGTSGKLTMLTVSTGMNSGQADAQEGTFDEIAVAQAGEISEVMQEQFDKPTLARLFPDQIPLAYFELAAKEESDVDGEFDRALKASQAGYRIDVAELSEKTGYTLSEVPATPPQSQGLSVFNRKTDPAAPQETFRQASMDAFAKALASDLAPLRERMAALVDELDTDDETARQEALAQLESELPNLFKAVRANGATDKALEDILTTAAVNGIDAASEKLAKIAPQKPSTAGMEK